MASERLTVDWKDVRELARRVLEKGETLELRDEPCAILRQGALDAGIDRADAERALASVPTATDLLREIRRRILDGQDRLHASDRRLDSVNSSADIAGTREAIERARGAEVVPYYRELLTDRLGHLDALEAVVLTGQLAADLSPWEQVRMLALRVQQGQPLDLSSEMRTFLREAAESVAIGAAETEEALQTAESAAALVGRLAANIREGRERLNSALRQWARLFEAGDLAGANRPLREYLAVETIPFYRKAAADLLTDDGEPPAGR